jgi:uncharacterized protein (TIRG00374 family)
VSIAILALLLWWLSPDVLLDAISRVSILVWGMVVIGFLLGHLLSALKWRLLLQVTGVNIPLLAAIRAHAAGLFANLCLPSLIGGDVVRAGMVMSQQKRYEDITLASVADRVNDTVALILIAAVAGVFVPRVAGIETDQLLIGGVILLLSAVVVVFVAIRWFPVARLPARLRSIVLRFRDAQSALIRSPGIGFGAFLMSLSIQGGFILLNVMLADEMGINAPLALWFFAWPMAKLIALAPVSLGGIGVREVAMAALMTPFGINSAQVVAQSLSWELVLIGSGLLAGLVSTLVPGTKREAKPSKE